MADFMGMMKQAAQLQAKMQAMQAELDTIEVEGVSGGGVVNGHADCKGDMKGVTHRPLADESRTRRKFSKIFWSPPMPTPSKKSESVMQEKMKALTGGLPLPPGLNLPFG